MSQQLKSQKIKALTDAYNKTLLTLTTTYNNSRTVLLRNRLMPLRTKNILLTQLSNKFISDKAVLYSNYKNSVAAINAMVEPAVVLTSTLTPVLTSTPTKKTALVIGINYVGTQNELNGCINDATNITLLLQTLKYDSITVLTDNTQIKPTRSNILSNLKTILSSAKDGDTIYIHYSGHGTDVTDTNGDEIDGKDEVIVPLDFNLITDDELNNYINTYLTTKANVLAVFDCCYSGTALDLKYLYKSETNNTMGQSLISTETKGNVILISGCKDDQTSSEAYTNNKIEGAMSWTFKNIIDTKGVKISWKTLIDSMRTTLVNSGFDQIPQLSSGKAININDTIVI